MGKFCKPRSRIGTIFVAFTMSHVVFGADLTIDRLFDAPALAGATIAGLRISPDASRITYLQGKKDNKDQLDLWEYNIAEAQARILVDSANLQTGNDSLSEEELNRRERQRTAAFSGILEYSFAASGQALLFPIGGALYYYDLSKPAKTALLKLTQSPGFVTDITSSPRAHYVAYIRDQNLFLYDLVKRKERALTKDGGDAIKNGMAEFVAQEEMGRSTGYWWSPDEAHIAFARVDESRVRLTQRFEIAADNITAFTQRYPAAGTPNVALKLGVVDVHSGATRWIELGTNPDFYLARVNWLPDGKTLAIQRESRDQRRLELLFADVATGRTRTVLTETSSTWIELHDELTFLRSRAQFVWASMRDGYQHLYLYDYNGNMLHQLTAGRWNVDDFHGRAIKAVDETTQTIYFTATKDNPNERQLYKTSLLADAPSDVERITQKAGLHSVAISPDAHFYVDTFTSVTQPTQVGIYSIGGELRAFLAENRLDDTHPDAPFLRTNSIPEFGTLPAADGQSLQYRLFKPANFDPKKRYPAIVDVYGGPGVQRVLNSWTGASFTQMLTRSGYLVFQLDNRGTASRGTDFQAPIHGKLGDVEVEDQVQGAKWLRDLPYVDRARIGVWGWSYGGYLTLMLMFKTHDVFRAGVSGAPVTDWSLYDTHYTERYLETPQENSEGYTASSVMPYAEDLTGKLLLMHGMADDNVLFLHSTKLMRKLQDLGKPFDTMVYPGAKHGLIRQHDGRHAYSTILNFFNRELAVKPGT